MTNFLNRFAAFAFCAALGSSFAFAQNSAFEILKAPRVPMNLQVPEGNSLFLQAQAQGTQNYVCLPSGSGFAWTFFSPQATLFITFRGIGGEIRQQITTHFLSPNPAENGTPRATWQSSFDTSAAWARAVQSSSDPNFVASGAIPWLLLQVVGTQRGPTKGDILAHTTFIQRLNTGGGIAPAAGCSQPANAGAAMLVPYTADYLFYKATPKY